MTSTNEPSRAKRETEILHQRIPQHLQHLIVSADTEKIQKDGGRSVQTSNFGTFIADGNSSLVIGGFTRIHCKGLYHIKGIQQIISNYCCFGLKKSLKNFVESTNEINLQKMDSKLTLYKINIVDPRPTNKNKFESIKSSIYDNYESFLAAVIGIHFGKYQYVINTITREDLDTKAPLRQRQYMHSSAAYSEWREKYNIPIKICDFNIKSDEFVDIDLYMDAIIHPHFIYGFKTNISFKYQSLDGINTKYPSLTNCKKRHINININKNFHGSINNVIFDMIDEMNNINDKNNDIYKSKPRHIDNEENLENEMSNFGHMYDFNDKQRVIESSVWGGDKQDNLSQLLKDCKVFNFSKCLLKHVVESKLLCSSLNKNGQKCNDIVCIGNKIEKKEYSTVVVRTELMLGDQGTVTDDRYNFFILNLGNMSQDENDYQWCLVWSGCYYRLSGTYNQS